MANTYLTRTMGTPTSRKKFTISVWVKRTKIGLSNAQHIWNGYYSADNRLVIYFQSSGNDRLGFYNVAGGSATAYIETNRYFRDTNAWYHIYYAVDTTQSTASDRIKLYINGQQETSLSANTYPSQNADLTFANGYTNLIGNYGAGSQVFDGLMSHFYYIDGSVIDIAQFGSTDATTGEWKINTNPTISSYGTNGFLILKDGNTITDQSPNSNNFTSNGAGVTKTEDCPSNVFNVWNMAARLNSTLYIDYGATQAYSDNSNWRSLTGTLGASSGKFYYEAMPVSHDYSVHGWVSDNLVNKTTDGAFAFAQLYSYGYKTYSGVVVYNENAGGGSTSYGVNIDPGDVLGCAIDIDNSKAYWSKNGVWLNSADPVNGTNGFSIQSGQTYVPAIAIRANNGNPTARCNFGNGYFGTTAVSSAGTNASNNGIFEYDVPTGYTALSTKGLNL